MLVVFRGAGEGDGVTYYEAPGVTLHHGDCLEVMRGMEPESFTAVVTDPPYGLEFMGKEWDTPGAFVERKSRRRAGSFESVQGNHNPVDAKDRQRTRLSEGVRFQAWCEMWATEALRILKPGGILLAFGGTRTYHRLACAIENAGFEVRDCLSWLYGSGFPKSLDISKAIDKAKGAEREIPRSFSDKGEGHDPKGTLTGRAKATGWCEACGKSRGSQPANCKCDTTGTPATPLAQTWHGYGTALKPAWEPIILAMKPLDGTFAGNAERHGVAGVNVDGCRVGTEGGTRKSTFPREESRNAYGNGINGACEIESLGKGRFPANLLLDETAAAMLDEQSGERVSSVPSNPVAVRRTSSPAVSDSGKGVVGAEQPRTGFNDSGGASRFFYTAKASKADRTANGFADNKHPTVKPVDLMRWLVRLVTMPTGTRILDPFMGSGSTIVAAREDSVEVVGIEQDEDSCRTAVDRLAQGVLRFD